MPTPDGAGLAEGSRPAPRTASCCRSGRGAPKLKGGGKGDLLARVRIDVPKKLKKAERELLEELQKVAG